MIMNSRKALTILFLLSFYSAAFAQEDSIKQNSKTVKMYRSTIVQVGLLEGQKSSSLQLQLINGLVYKTWQLGIGAGLDYYYVRSIPLFLDVRKTVAHFPLFAYADGGVHFPWQKTMETFAPVEEYNKGLYYDVGIGYKFASKKRSHFMLSAGYSEKKMSIVNENVNPCFYPPCPTYKNEYDFQLRRLSFKAGMRF
jgi:hypothetical protein